MTSRLLKDHEFVDFLKIIFSPATKIMMYSNGYRNRLYNAKTDLLIPLQCGRERCLGSRVRSPVGSPHDIHKLLVTDSPLSPRNIEDRVITVWFRVTIMHHTMAICILARRYFCVKAHPAYQNMKMMGVIGKSLLFSLAWNTWHETISQPINYTLLKISIKNHHGFSTIFFYLYICWLTLLKVSAANLGAFSPLYIFCFN